MDRELISIIAPCYNVEKTLERYLKSILDQTYKCIEVIAIDDGSTDRTAEILKKYVSVFEEKGMALRYVYQKNAGLGSAINTGLKYVTGEYLCWSDPDDFYMIDSMEKRLNIFHEYPEYSVVSSDAYVFDEHNLNCPIKREAERFEHRYESDQFELLLKEESHFCAGCHMVRMSDFEKANPERTIYPARRGQNWQLLLPVYYQCKRYFLDEPLYAYIIYSHSMSGNDITEEKEMFRWKEHEEILCQTLKRIPLNEDERNEYNKIINIRYAIKRFFTAIDYRDKKEVKAQYLLIKEYGGLTKELKISYLRNYYTVWKIILKIRDIMRGNYV